MARRKRRKEQRKQQTARPSGALHRVLRRAQELIQAGQYAEAREFLEGYRDRHADNAYLIHLLGLAAAGCGDVRQAMTDMERAVELGPRFSPSLLFPLALTYQQAGMHIHAIRALRRLLQEHPRDVMASAAREMLAELDAQSQAGAEQYGVSREQFEEANYWLDRCRRALDEERWADAEQDAARAAQMIPSWPPPRNNRALALYFMGRPQEAVQAAREVLELDPQNVHALSNLVRFHVALDEREAAQEALDRLRALDPADIQRADQPHHKLAEAYAAMNADQDVYDVLRQARRAGEHLGPTSLYMLGVAAANLGQAREARRYWQESLKLAPAFVPPQLYGDLVRQGRPGPGLADRYPYLAPANWVPKGALDEFLVWLGRVDDMDEAQRRREGAEWASRYPALHLLGARAIWEENQPLAGIMMLRALGTPRAAREIQRFAEGQLGTDDDRMEAAQILLELGVYDPDTPVRLWQDGAWRTVYVRQFIVTDEPESEYAPDIIDMINRAIVLTNEGQHDEARALYRQVLERDPQVKEAWGNLGAMALWKDDREAGEAYLRRALEVDPLYPFAVCNLAMLYLSDGKLDEARDLLQALGKRTRFNQGEIIYYMRVQARLAILEKDWEAARRCLEYVLELDPDNQAAKDQLVYLELIGATGKLADLAVEYQARARQRWEKRRAETILTPDATLVEGLAPFTKDTLVGMTHALGITGISGKRKAEMRDAIVDWLRDPDCLAWSWRSLTAEDRAALRYVLDAGGWVPWEEFSQRYDDDSKESLYWNYRQPETIMGRLRVRGLLVEGTMSDQAVLLVPRELREPLAWLLMKEGEGLPADDHP